MNYVVCSSAWYIVQMHELLIILYKDESSVVQLFVSAPEHLVL